jgi:hypothetical protein
MPEINCKHEGGNCHNTANDVILWRIPHRGDGMDKQGDIEALRALARDQAAKTKMARLRDIFDEIEATQNAGVPNRKIVETLNARGYDLTPKTFESALYRIRKEREAQGITNTHEAPQIKSVEPVLPATPNRTEPAGSPPQRRITNPADLKRARQRDFDMEGYANPDTEDG